MGFYNIDIRVRYEDVDKNNNLTMRGFLKYLLEATTSHSAAVGYGLNDIPNTHLTWLILDWKLKVNRYPHTGEAIHIRTWASFCKKIYSIRDYEVLDNAGNRIAICSSKWIPINTVDHSIIKITPELMEAYGPIDISVFNSDIEKLVEPKVDCLNRFDYSIMRRDLDTNKHVNNLNYLDFALETLPEDVYEHIQFENLSVMYKKQCLYGDKISCLYYLNENNEHVVVIKSADLKVLHAIIVFS